jgi:hypothetical protein
MADDFFPNPMPKAASDPTQDNGIGNASAKTVIHSGCGIRSSLIAAMVSANTP